MTTLPKSMTPLSYQELRLWILWALATAVSFTIIKGADTALYTLAELGSVFTIACGCASAILVASLQWLAIRKLLPLSGLWIPATIVGFTVGSLLEQGYLEVLFMLHFKNGVYQPSSLPHVLELAQYEAGKLLLGLAVGSLQYLLLQLRFQRAYGWLIACAGSFYLGSYIFTLLLGRGGPFAWPWGIVRYALQYGLVYGGLFIGGITGGCLIWLMRQPLQASLER